MRRRCLNTHLKPAPTDFKGLAVGGIGFGQYIKKKQQDEGTINLHCGACGGAGFNCFMYKEA